MNIEIHPKTVFKYLLCLITFLLFANCLGLLSNFYFGHDHAYGLVPLFSLNVENNVPTFYSSCALLVSSTLLLFIALSHKKMATLIYPGWDCRPSKKELLWVLTILCCVVPPLSY